MSRMVSWTRTWIYIKIIFQSDKPLQNRSAEILNLSIIIVWKSSKTSNIFYKASRGRPIVNNANNGKRHSIEAFRGLGVTVLLIVLALCTLHSAGMNVDTGILCN